ncbi:hypothetical protein HZH68_007569 [Vespula germanica]|uniref:Uncharacterized protein n=1 Tax=Vespula germanica TaxID=30212 RepID=A0A834NB81_VESGE|nr:hypothetical protein HZH68_007569 [Vespula germanica]
MDGQLHPCLTYSNRGLTLESLHDSVGSNRRIIEKPGALLAAAAASTAAAATAAVASDAGKNVKADHLLGVLVKSEKQTNSRLEVTQREGEDDRSVSSRQPRSGIRRTEKERVKSRLDDERCCGAGNEKGEDGSGGEGGGGGCGGREGGGGGRRGKGGGGGGVDWMEEPTLRGGEGGDEGEEYEEQSLKEKKSEMDDERRSSREKIEAEKKEEVGPRGTEMQDIAAPRDTGTDQGESPGSGQRGGGTLLALQISFITTLNHGNVPHSGGFYLYLSLTDFLLCLLSQIGPDDLLKESFLGVITPL